MERESMVFYRSWYEAIMKLPVKKRDMVFHALFEYALNGEEIELPVELAVLVDVCRTQIDVNNKRYENGQKGGRPRTKTDEKKPSDNQTITKPNHRLSTLKPNVNVNVNENENVNVNENVYENADGSPDGSSETSDTPDTPEKPNAFHVIKEAAENGHTMTASEAKKFLEYNEAHGWKLEWKYALKRWLDQEQQRPRGKPKLKNDVSEKHNYTEEQMAELRRRAKE